MVKQTIQALWQTIIRIFAFIGKEIRIIWHQPRLVFSLILGPFFILLLFGLGYKDVPRTLNTLFVVPEGSPLESSIEEYMGSFQGGITFAGITHDAAEADRRLRAQEVDLVVVTPGNPTVDWENDQQSAFSLYHYEIDPMEEIYIQVLGQRYIEEINRQLLLTAVTQSQQEAQLWHEDLIEAKAHAATAREAFAAGDRLRAQSSAETLKQDVDLLTLALGSGLAIAAGLEEASGQATTTSALLTQLETLQDQTDEVMVATAEDRSFSEGETTVAEVEASLEEVDGMLAKIPGNGCCCAGSPFSQRIFKRDAGAA